MIAYYELRKFIDANFVLHPSEAYQKLINGLNALIEQYNTILNTRPVETEPEPEKVAD